MAQGYWRGAGQGPAAGAEGGGQEGTAEGFTPEGITPENWRLLVGGLHEAVVVLDPEGVVRLANPPAEALFPDARVGAPAAPGGRSQQLGDGWVAHYRTPEDLLDGVTRRLDGAVDRDDALRAVVELAPAAHAVVVAPGQRGRLEWWRRSSGGDVVVSRGTRQVAEGVPGLTDVLDVLDGVAGVDRAREGVELVEPGDAPWGLPAGAPTKATAVPLTPGAALVCFGPSGDAGLLRRFAERATAAIAAGERFGEQRRTVDALRAGLLPTPLPQVAGARLAQVFEPAHRATMIGGDFYDVHPRDDGSAAFALGDVAGNGVEAAVHSGRVRQSLHTLLLVEQRPAQLLHLLNTVLRAAGSRLFTTIVVGTFVPVQAGGLRMTLAAGGHPSPLVLRSGGRVDEIAVRGGIVGVLPEVRFSQATVTLSPGETLLLYSDGVTEARSRGDRAELFGDERLSEALAGCAGLGAQEIAERLRGVVFEWLGDAEHDDLTLLVVQAEG
ncbi:PP2C family protein-serine/threonine phosphatase [Actinosynnema pretiosum]|uniref:Serine/threonine protein phosphatase n=1 Tax=Actinosynnema pretiosum TaxID=42197 RepID=A0A290ZB24_9PSEU|nr:SpoIIE family protein phosphatase [Actinosynnema pretiosum]ATE56179.1 serine/threonine protein phosphatase [Actinosynnema pretiosum]